MKKKFAIYFLNKPDKSDPYNLILSLCVVLFGFWIKFQRRDSALSPLSKDEGRYLVDPTEYVITFGYDLKKEVVIKDPAAWEWLGSYRDWEREHTV